MAAARVGLSALSIVPLVVWSATTPEPRRFVDLAVYAQAVLLDGYPLFIHGQACGDPSRGFALSGVRTVSSLPLGQLGRLDGRRGHVRHRSAARSRSPL